MNSPTFSTLAKGTNNKSPFLFAPLTWILRSLSILIAMSTILPVFSLMINSSNTPRIRALLVATW